MANEMTDEELEELNKKLKEKTTLSMNENSYEAMLENLGKKEGYDYISDYKVLKNSHLAQSYSPRANKVYTYEEAQALTPKQYWEDVMSAADHTDNDFGALKTFIWGANEALGTTGLYKAIKGEEATKNKLNQVERVYGNNQVARTAGNIVGSLALYTTANMLGGPLGAGAAGALSGGGRGYTYSNEPSKIATEAIKGGTTALAFAGIANTLRSAFPIYPTTVQNVAKNAGIGATAGYSSTTLGKLEQNLSDTLRGEDVTGEDWLKSFYGLDNAMSAGLSAITYAIGGTIADKQQAKINLEMAKNDYAELNEALFDRGVKMAETAYKNGDFEGAMQIARQGDNLINLMQNTKYDGVVVDPNVAYEPIRNAWYKIMDDLSRIYSVKIPAGTSNVPTNVNTTTYSNPPASIGLNALPIALGNVPMAIDSSNLVKYNNQNGGVYDGGQLQETNIRGVGKVGRTSSIELSNDGLNEIYVRSKPNYDATKRAGDEAKQFIINDVSEKEKQLLKSASAEAETPVYLVDFSNFRDGTYGGLTSPDGIFIDSNTAQEYGFENVYWHERAEDLYLNHPDVSAVGISKLIKKLEELEKSDRVLTKIWKDFFKEDKNSKSSDKQKQKYIKKYDSFAKEMLFNIYSLDKEVGRGNTFYKIIGEKMYNDVVDTIDTLMKEAKGKPKVRLDNLNGSEANKLNITNEPQNTKPQSEAKNGNIANFPRKDISEHSATKEQSNGFTNENKDLSKQLKIDNTSYTNAIKSKGEKIERLQGDVAKANEKVAKTNTQLKNVKANNKEVVKGLKSQNKRDVANAVKEVKAENKEALKKQKAKDQAILKEAKLDAKATTTKKKFGRANTKLEKALTNVYDKPQSKELDTALEALKKATRGTTKLINKVRTQIPSSMSVVIDDINEILDTYYTGANKMTDEKRASLVKKAEAIEKYMEEHPTVPVSKQALNVLKEQTKKSLSDLNPRDLVDLAENVQTIGMDLRDAMSFTRASEDAVKLREEAINFVKGEIAKGGGRTDTPMNKTANTGVEFMRGYNDFNSNIRRLITNLSGGNPNSPLYFIDDRLREGTKRYFENQETLLKPWEKFVTVKRVPGLGKKVVNELDYVFNPKNTLKLTLKTSRGEDYKISLRDAISIVLGRKDIQFAGHTVGVVTDKLGKDGKPIISEGGYVILANQADAINGNINKGLKRGVRVKLTNKIVDQMQAELEQIPEAKAVMDTYSNSSFLKDNAKTVNDAYEAITGMSIDERENYFRTVVNPNDRRRVQSQDPTKSADLSAKDALLNTSIVKPVVEGANNSIYIYPIDEVINKMIDDTSIYGAFATELYDIETFLDAKDEDGVSLRELIGNLDPDFLGELGQIEDAIIHRRHNNVGANILNKTKNLVGNYSGSILHGNAFLALKQIGSLPTAAPFFQTPVQSILNGVFNKSGIEKMVREYYEELGEDVSSLSDKEVFDKFFQEATTELETRKRGYTKPTKAEIFKYASPLKRIAAFDWHKGADSWTVNTLAYAMVYDYLTNFGKEMDHTELVRELGSQFIKMHYATQPNTAPYTRTLGQLSDNPLARAALYMADPRLKQLNTTVVARQHYKWSKENGTAEEKKKYGREFAEAIIGALGGMAYIISLNELKSSLKKKDEERTAKDVAISAIANTISIYAIGFDMIINRMISKDYDFDVSIPDTEVINKVYEMYNHGKNLVKHLTNGEENYKYKDVKNIISDLSYITGIPVKNIQDDFIYFLSATDSELYYEMKVKEDTNMYKKYLQFEDRIDDYKEFYKLYKATRESAVKEKYGAYNNKNIKKAIQDVDGDVSIYYKVFKLGK